MLLHHANFVLRHKFLDGLAGERTVDVQTLSEDRRSNKFVLRHFLVQLIVSVLVEKNKVVGLLLDLHSRKCCC